MIMVIKKALCCYHCNKYGHFARNCRCREKDQNEENGKSQSNENKEKLDGAFYSALSVSSDSHCCGYLWYLDSAATIYMTNDVIWLRNIKKAFSCVVFLDIYLLRNCSTT